MSSHVTNGTVNDGYAAMRPARLLARPRLRICAYSGMNRIDGGTRYVISVALARKLRPRNRSRASAYAPIVPTAVANSVLDNATVALLPYHDTKSVFESSCP